jgi:hypothetical protein
MLKLAFPFLGVFAFCAFVALFQGCAHYRVGTGAELSFRTLYVAPVESEADAPQARSLVWTRLRETLLRDSRITLVGSPQEADATLVVVLKKYGRDATVSKADDTGLARKFSLTLQADCSLTLRDGKQLFANKRVTAQKEAYVDSGQLQSEYNTLPYLADSLALSIKHAALDVW